MAIEFTCDSCLAVLRTADTNAALPATCPACGDPLHVPKSISVARPERVLPPVFHDRPASRPLRTDDRPTDDDRLGDGSARNGRHEVRDDAGRRSKVTSRAPTDAIEIVVCEFCGTRNLPEATACRNCDEPFAAATSSTRATDEPSRTSGVEPFGIDDVVSRSWDVFRREFGPCLLGYVVCGLGWMAGLIGGLIPLLLMIPLFGMRVIPRPGMVILPYLVFVGFVITTYSQIGQMLYFEHVVRERNGNLALLFRGSRFVLRMIGLNIVFAIVVGVGLVAFVVPGLVLYTVFWPAAFILVEQDCGVFTALDRARRMTHGHRGTLFLVTVVTLLVTAVGGASGLGMLVTAPISSLLAVVAYLHLAGLVNEDHPEPWVEEYPTDPIVGEEHDPVERWLKPDPA